MGFIDSIISCFKSEELPKEPIFRAVLFGEEAAYFENVCAINYYSVDEICLRLKKGGLKIKGSELYLKKYCAGDIAVCGKIKSVERV